MKIYTSDQVTCAICNLLMQTGRGEKEFLKIRPKNPRFSSKAGADGEVSRSRSNDKRAEVELTLMQTSDGNALLSTLFLADSNAPNGAGVGSFLVKDMGGTSLYVGDACWITEMPEVTFSNEVEQRVWKIEVANLVDFTGGN